MKRILFGALALIVCTASIARAQATRTWVSGVGDDANPCSRTAPCKTWAGAISKTADGGEIDALDPGGFGAVTITKSITLDGGSELGSILAAGSNGIIVSAAGEKVILRRLSINGVSGSISPGLNGISVVNVGELHVEDCNIFGFSQKGITYPSSAANGKLYVENTTISNTTQAGIDFSSAGGFVYVSNTQISASGNAALYVGNAHGAVDRLIATGNQTGVLAAGSANVTVKNSTAAGGSMGFAAAYGPTAVINMEDCVSTNNDYGVVVGSGATARVSNSSIFHSNIAGLYNDGSSFLISYGNNRLNANAVDGSFTSIAALR